MWRIFKHGVNVLFYPFIAGQKVVHLLPRGKGREQVARILDHTFRQLQANVARLDACNKSGRLDAQESRMVFETWRFQANEPASPTSQ